MVEKKLSVSVNFLNYLSAELEGESSFSLMVFDQAVALVDRDKDSWVKGIEKWKTDNKVSILTESVYASYRKK